MSEQLRGYSDEEKPRGELKFWLPVEDKKFLREAIRDLGLLNIVNVFEENHEEQKLKRQVLGIDYGQSPSVEITIPSDGSRDAHDLAEKIEKRVEELKEAEKK